MEFARKNFTYYLNKVSAAQNTCQQIFGTNFCRKYRENIQFLYGKYGKINSFLRVVPRYIKWYELFLYTTLTDSIPICSFLQGVFQGTYGDSLRTSVPVRYVFFTYLYLLLYVHSLANLTLFVSSNQRALSRVLCVSHRENLRDLVGLTIIGSQ